VDNFDIKTLTANQYRARAQLARSTAAKMDKPATRQQLLKRAEEYEWIADSMERLSKAKSRWI
jgi:hypothetical protein